jgi:hypothetical protein
MTPVASRADQYFMGLNTSITRSGVQYIIDGVVDYLGQNPDRKFIYVSPLVFEL